MVFLTLLALSLPELSSVLLLSWSFSPPVIASSLFSLSPLFSAAMNPSFSRVVMRRVFLYFNNGSLLIGVRTLTTFSFLYSRVLSFRLLEKLLNPYTLSMRELKSIKNLKLDKMTFKRYIKIKITKLYLK